MYNIVMTEFKDMVFMKVFYELEGIVVGMDVFQLKDEQIIQISPGVLTPEEEGKLKSGVFDRSPDADEVLMVQEIFRSRMGYALQKTVDYINHVEGVVLLGLYEVSGRFFALTTHDNLKFLRIAEVGLTAPELPVVLEEVPKEFLPYVCEKIASKLLEKKNKGITLQIGDGLFVRLRRQSSTAFATVVMLESSKKGTIESVSAPVGFALSLKDGNWSVLPEDEAFAPKIFEEMQRAFDHVTNELASMMKEHS